MFCKNCGKEIQGTPDFCPNCGTKISETSATPVAPSTPAATSAPVAETKAGKSKVAAVLLAIFLAFWTWLYTYKKDSLKFWVGLAVVIVVIILRCLTLGIAGLFAWILSFGVWLWAVIDTVRKTEDWYKNY